MSDNDIKELVKRLRAPEMFLNRDRQEAADALEAMRSGMRSAVAERDRLKAALVRLRDCDWVIRLPDRMDGVRQIAREALEAKDE